MLQVCDVTSVPLVTLSFTISFPNVQSTIRFIIVIFKCEFSKICQQKDSFMLALVMFDSYSWCFIIMFSVISRMNICTTFVADDLVGTTDEHTDGIQTSRGKNNSKVASYFYLPLCDWFRR